MPSRESYDNPELQSDFVTLESFREQRAGIAYRAAKYIMEERGGQTTDGPLYYAAMFGRSYEEGVYEHDPNLVVPMSIIRELERSEGQPLLVRDTNYPDMNVSIGVVASLSTEVFEPARFEFTMKHEEEGFRHWESGLAIAMRKVVPKRDGEADTYELAEEVSKIIVCDTEAWTSSRDGLEIHAKGTGGVETGEAVHLNSEHGKRYHDKLAFWLRQHLAPTERRTLSAEGLSTQKAIRATRQEMARISNMSEGQVAARSLSPTIAAFFNKLRPYGESKESTPIDIKALYADWRDAYDAQSLLAEIEGRELVEVNQDGQLVVSQLGKEALALLREDYGY